MNERTSEELYFQVLCTKQYQDQIKERELQDPNDPIIETLNNSINDFTSGLTEEDRAKIYYFNDGLRKEEMQLVLNDEETRQLREFRDPADRKYLYNRYKTYDTYIEASKKDETLSTTADAYGRMYLQRQVLNDYARKIATKINKDTIAQYMPIITTLQDMEKAMKLKQNQENLVAFELDPKFQEKRNKINAVANDVWRQIEDNDFQAVDVFMRDSGYAYTQYVEFGKKTSDSTVLTDIQGITSDELDHREYTGAPTALEMIQAKERALSKPKKKMRIKSVKKDKPKTTLKQKLVKLAITGLALLTVGVPVATLAKTLPLEQIGDKVIKTVQTVTNSIKEIPEAIANHNFEKSIQHKLQDKSILSPVGAVNSDNLMMSQGEIYQVNNKPIEYKTEDGKTAKVNVGSDIQITGNASNVGDTTNKFEDTTMDVIVENNNVTGVLTNSVMPKVGEEANNIVRHNTTYTFETLKEDGSKVSGVLESDKLAKVSTPKPTDRVFSLSHPIEGAIVQTDTPELGGRSR